MGNSLHGIKKIKNIDKFCEDMFLCEIGRMRAELVSSKYHISKYTVIDIKNGTYNLYETLSTKEIYDLLISKTGLTKREIAKLNREYGITEIYYGKRKNGVFVPNENHGQEYITIRQDKLLCKIYEKLEVLRSNFFKLGKEKLKQES